MSEEMSNLVKGRSKCALICTFSGIGILSLLFPYYILTGRLFLTSLCGANIIFLWVLFLTYGLDKYNGQFEKLFYTLSGITIIFLWYALPTYACYGICIAVTERYITGTFKTIKMDKNSKKGNNKKILHELFHIIWYTVSAILGLVSLNELGLLNVGLYPLHYGFDAIWKSFPSKSILPPWVNFYMNLQLGHYLQGFIRYSLNFRESWKNDRVMFVHHFITFFTLYFAASIRIEPAIFVLFTHDVSDIFLHLSKYYNISNKSKHIIISYTLLVITWIYYRMLSMPYFAYSSFVDAPVYGVLKMEDGTGIASIALSIIFVCHCIWFVKIVKIGYKHFVN